MTGFRRAILLAVVAGVVTAAGSRAAEPVKNRPPLAPGSFYPLPLTSVKPQGWLREQLRIQAEGITGHLDEFWPDVGPNSAWLGGAGEGWERGPYYLDGLLPLAYLLEDEKLIAKVKPWVEWTLTHQRNDGSIGPEKNRDWWPIMIMLKVLAQYQEATGDPRVIPVMEKYFAYQSAMLSSRPLESWAVYRWQDELASVVWTYNRTGDAKLLQLAGQLKQQGFDWRKHFENFVYLDKVTREQAKHDTHGVNNAMGLKAAALWYLISKDPGDREATGHMLEALDRYQGLPNGMFSADEHYAGRNPSQGIETCAVVESMFSLEQDLRVLGDAALGDRLEKIAFNPLPGLQTSDMWGHQYDQQPNQVMCSLGRRDWTTNGPESNLFGLEPNFGCCTANLHQGWPKFAASLWMASADGGLAVAAYGPSTVKSKASGVDVTVEEATDYPFRDRITLAVTPARPVRFPLRLRIPAWTNEPRIRINGQTVEAAGPGAWQRIEREWRAGDRVEITLPMPVRVIRGFHDSISVERGPLIYSLRIAESWSKLKQTGPAADWEVFPTSPWNYALRVDGANPERSFEVEEAPLARQPFNNQSPPVVLRAKARRLPQWMMVDDSAAAPPQSPVASRLKDETVTLIPYGAARLRITAFPVLGPDQPEPKKQ
ncbi:MAG TPA: beta-L-arabinofuranosidase domain-containing protein [Bryobacteraceae bacterium]|nr:beta-L-arabinofuranosidase domain-containing protein [Bryobacteraceae bacterium]